MPELPDITVYIERLQALVQGQVLQRVQVLNPFLLRTAVPPLAMAEGRTVAGVERLGKRVVLALDGGPLLVLHLMIAGRLRWVAPGGKAPGKAGTLLARFEFASGMLLFTEAGTTRRASLHVLADRAALAAADPGGIDVFDADLAAFTQRLRSENHTLKRALTDPRLISGIGNAYSDEILFAARLSPVTLTRKLTADELQRLFDSARAVLTAWTARLRDEAAARPDGWPDKVTAFHPQMTVHGRYGQPCPVCATPVQRIVYGRAPKLATLAAPRGGAAALGAAQRAASNETNYCARCQTGGRLLADRALSTLLKKSWPKTVDDL